MMLGKDLSGAQSFMFIYIYICVCIGGTHIHPVFNLGGEVEREVGFPRFEPFWGGL